jgi:dienelactone hydrolase
MLAATPGVGPGRLAVVGRSYGGYLATLLLDERPVRWLALQAPAIYRHEGFDRPKRELNLDGALPEYRRRRLAPEDNRVLAAAARFRGHVLLVAAEHDTVIPPAVVDNDRRAFERSASSVTSRTLAGADHALSRERWRRAWGDLLARWLTRCSGLSWATSGDQHPRGAERTHRSRARRRATGRLVLPGS